jgi:ATP-dependent Lhr-like helicase
MRRVLPESVLEEVGKLDPAAIEQVRREAWPDVRDADELHDVLHTLVALPLEFAPNHVETGAPSASSGQALARLVEQSSTIWTPLFRQLESQKRALTARLAERRFWIATERVQAFTAHFPDAIFEITPPDLKQTAITADDALLTAVTGWMSHIGPTTASELGGLLGIPASEIEKALLRMEASGAILRGQFSGTSARTGMSAPHGTPSETEWCDRRLLARIHRLTVATLRKQIEPVTPAQFMRWLLRWQHVAPGSHVQGERATLEILRQLQGFEVPANAWESQVLARRIAGYDPTWLDQLCLTGAVGWGRLSPHPATLEASTKQPTPSDSDRVAQSLFCS